MTCRGLLTTINPGRGFSAQKIGRPLKVSMACLQCGHVKAQLWIFGFASQLGPRASRTRQRWEDGSMEIAAPRPWESAVQSR